MKILKHANSVWNEVPIDDIEIISQKLPVTKVFYPEEYLLTPNGLKFYYTTAIFTGMQPPPLIAPIVIDELELQVARTYMKNMRLSKKIDICGTFTSFLITFPEKKIYLRYFNSTKRDENRRVFMDEVVEMIPLLLAKQKTHARKLSMRLRKFQQQWMGNAEHCHTIPTLTLDELNTILESFDIDKSVITLVPDMLFAGQVRYLLHARSTYSSLTIDGPDGHETVPVAHGIFLLFQVFVMEVDWNSEVMCREHGSTCNLSSYRKAILRVFQEYMDIGERFHITKQKLVMDLAELKLLCNYKLRSNKPFTPGLEYLYCDFSDQITMFHLVSKIKEFHLSGYTNQPNFPDEHLKNVLIPVWKARIVFIHLWAMKFFGYEHPDIKDVVMRTSIFRIPCIRWDEGDPLKFMLSSDPGLKKEELFVGKRNTTDLLQYVLEVTSKYCRFSHPWFTFSAIRQWYADPNIMRCGKWMLQDMTEEVRDGRRVAKRMLNMEKLISEYNTKALEAFNLNLEVEEKMSKQANEILRQILVKDEDESEKNLEEDEEEDTVPEDSENWEMAEEDELIDGIRQLCNCEMVRIRPDEKPPVFIGQWSKLGEQFEAELHEKLEKKTEVLSQLDRLEKRGVNQWKNVRTLRKIVEDSPRQFAVHYYDFLEIEQQSLMRSYRDELQKELDEAQRRCKSKERQIRSLQLLYSSKCEPSTSSEALD